MKLKSCAFILSFFVASSAFAAGGDELGNGGDALICKENGVLTYRLFDLADVISNGGLTPRATPELEADIEKEVLEQLRLKDPERACLYEQGLASFRRQSLHSDLPLYDVSDEGFVQIPKNCGLKQVIIQFKKNSAYKYFVDSDLYFKLPPRDRVALRFHELIYREGLRMNTGRYVNSLAVRKMTAFLFSNELKTSSPQEYEQAVTNVGLSMKTNYCELVK
jgi:hypothetical protein